MSEVLLWIKSLIGTGEIASIVYMGGSRPGSVRNVVFQKLEAGETKVRVIEVGRPGVSKCFFVEKIVRADEKTASQLASSVEAIEQYNSLDDLFAAAQRIELPPECALNFDPEKKKIALIKIKRFKNGNSRAREAFSISYVEFVTAFEFIDDEMVEVKKPATRKWAVGKKRFSLFNSAAKEFMKLLKSDMTA